MNTSLHLKQRSTQWSDLWWFHSEINWNCSQIWQHNTNSSDQCINFVLHQTNFNQKRHREALRELTLKVSDTYHVCCLVFQGFPNITIRFKGPLSLSGFEIPQWEYEPSTKIGMSAQNKIIKFKCNFKLNNLFRLQSFMSRMKLAWIFIPLRESVVPSQNLLHLIRWDHQRNIITNANTDTLQCLYLRSSQDYWVILHCMYRYLYDARYGNVSNIYVIFTVVRSGDPIIWNIRNHFPLSTMHCSIGSNSKVWASSEFQTFLMCHHTGYK